MLAMLTREQLVVLQTKGWFVKYLDEGPGEWKVCKVFQPPTEKFGYPIQVTLWVEHVLEPCLFFDAHDLDDNSYDISDENKTLISKCLGETFDPNLLDALVFSALWELDPDANLLRK